MFVLPSLMEPWGLVINEVMNAGRAVIVSDQVGAAADLVRDGDNGFVFPAGDADALSDCLLKTLSDPHLCKRMCPNWGCVEYSYPLGQEPEGAEIIMDSEYGLSEGIEVVGNWGKSTLFANWKGFNYLHDWNGGKGNKHVRYNPDIEMEGMYQVYMFWNTDKDPGSQFRHPAVPVDVVPADGSE